MRDLDITSLRLFVAMCEHQNISAAARQEHIAPSAASKRIAQLADAVNAPLFERRRRGVELTPAGRTLLEHAHTVLYTISRIRNDIAALHEGVRGHVRLLAAQSVIAEDLPGDIAAFMRAEENFKIKVDIEQMFSRDIVRVILEGSTAIGVLWDRTDLCGLPSLPYRTDQLALVVHPDHPLAKRKTVRFAETMAFEHVGQRPGGSVHQVMQRAAMQAGRELVYRAIVSGFEVALCVVAAGLAVSIIPMRMREAVNGTGLHFIPLDEPWALRQFVLCFHDFNALEPAAQRLINHLAGTMPAGLTSG